MNRQKKIETLKELLKWKKKIYELFGTTKEELKEDSRIKLKIKELEGTE